MQFQREGKAAYATPSYEYLVVGTLHWTNYSITKSMPQRSRLTKPQEAKSGEAGLTSLGCTRCPARRSTK
jgi:hypothetical protein